MFCIGDNGIRETFSKETNSEHHEKTVKMYPTVVYNGKEQLWGDKNRRKMSEQINGIAS